MDNKKIGKLIASLRKKQGLTQQSLGDKVGVGFRAVSKWERGLTLPDISIINELSEILGISSDELLSGELKKENKIKDKKKIPTSIKITIFIIAVFVVTAVSILIYTNNKTYVYDLKKPDNTDYYVEGQTTFKGDEITIIINKVRFTDENLNSTIIQNYDYEITSDNILLFGYGNIPDGKYIDEAKTITEYINNIRINYEGKTDLKKQEIVENNIEIKFTFYDENYNTITKELEIKLIPKI